MKTTRKSQTFSAMGALLVAGGMATVACSKADTVNNQGAGGSGAQVSTCGVLSAQQAAQIATSQLEHLGTVGLAALAGLENSRVAARLVTFGDMNITDPFVADGQSGLHDSLVELRDKQLVAGNVEITTASSVTFLLRPETVCSSASSAPVAMPTAGGASGIIAPAGGTTSTTLDPYCVANNVAHPQRIRISRIACEEGDNVAIELLQGTASERILAAELHADHADIQVDIGAFLRQSYSVSYSSSSNGTTTTPTQRTEKPVVTSATGLLEGSLTLTGAQSAKANVSITQPIDITMANSSADRLQFAVCTNGVTAEADGAAKTIKLTANANAFDWRTRFDYFISDFFGLQASAAAATAEPVMIHVAGLQGSLDFNGTQDSLTATGLNLGGSDATAKQGTNTLLSIGAGAAPSTINATFTGKANDNLGVALPQGLAVAIHYGLQPVVSLITSPANFLANDTLSLSAATNSNLTLISDPTTNEISAMQSLTGILLRVDSGSLGLSSTVWPADAVNVPAAQCLTRTVTSVAGHHDLLDDFTVGACAAQ